MQLQYKLNTLQKCNIKCSTERELLPGIRRQRESKQSHGRDEDARDDEVETVIQGSPANVDIKSDVHVRFGTACVHDHVPRAGNT